MSSSFDISLEHLPRSRSPSRAGDVAADISLPAPDRGRAAYLVLASCAALQAPVWGYSLAFGIFQQYYTAHNDVLHASPSAIASVGSVQTGVLYLAMAAVLALLTQRPAWRRLCGPLGLLLSVASLVASAFAATVAQLIATQGVLYALGCAMVFSPASLYLDEWFDAKKGLAYSLMWSGKSLVGVAMPFLMSLLLDRFGLRPVLLGWAAASALMTLPVLVYQRPRVPLAARRPPPPPPPAHRSSSSNPHGLSSPQPSSFAFLRLSLFWLAQLGIFAQALGYMLPSTYLASYAASLGLARLSGPLLLALSALAAVPGSILLGLLADRLPATTVLLISSLGSALAAFGLWGFGTRLPVLALFATVYGFFAGAFSSTWSGLLREVRRQVPATDTGLVFGMLMGVRGLGFVLSGPVSGALLMIQQPSAASSPSSSPAESEVLPGDAVSSYSSVYGPMVICTGATAVLGACGWLWTLGKPCRRLVARARLLLRSS